MKRRVVKKKGSTARVAPKEPMIEDPKIVIPRTKSGMCKWHEVDDATLIAYTRQLIKENGITSRTELQKMKGSTYSILRKRGLMEEIGLENKNIRWIYVDSETIFAEVEQFVRKNRITSRTELCRLHSGYYAISVNRGLMERLFGKFEAEERERKEKMKADEAAKNLAKDREKKADADKQAAQDFLAAVMELDAA